MHAWTITVDNVAGPSEPNGAADSAVGLVGPRSTKLSAEQIIAHPEAKQFRMFDDDNILYYEGYLIGDEFGPLDDFGEPNAGCTSIAVLEGSSWVIV